MIRPEPIQADDAIELFNNAGMIARKSAHGNAVIIYTGEEDKPGTWLEANRYPIRRDGTIFAVNPFAARN